ncbi:MAG: SH3 domain-containing protein [bacterium]|nr:SH3 domain-containing protein [bacterium]
MASRRIRPAAGLAIVFCTLVLFALVGLSVIDVQAQAQFGTGWNGQFFNTPDLTGAVVYTQAFPTGINVNWGTSSPAPGVVNVDGWSARFESVQLFNEGTYEFVVASDDGVRVFIDNVLVLDRFVGRVLTTDRFQQTLTAGTHTLRIEYFDSLDQAALQFQWFQVSGGLVGTGTPGFGGGGVSLTPTVVPTITPTALPPIPPGAQTGTVIRATVLRVRSAPYLGAPQVGRILRGQTYQVIGRDPDARWFLLQLSSTQGWAWGYYLFVSGNEFNAPVRTDFATSGDPAASSRMTIQTNAVMALRAAPDVTSAQIGRVTWGEILPVIGRTNGNGWYQVVFRGDTIGWLASGFVTILDGDPVNVPVTG